MQAFDVLKEIFSAALSRIDPYHDLSRMASGGFDARKARRRISLEDIKGLHGGVSPAPARRRSRFGRGGGLAAALGAGLGFTLTDLGMNTRVSTVPRISTAAMMTGRRGVAWRRPWPRWGTWGRRSRPELPMELTMPMPAAAGCRPKRPRHGPEQRHGGR